MSALAKAAVSFEAAAVVETATFAAINSRIFDRHWGASSVGLSVRALDMANAKTLPLANDAVMRPTWRVSKTAITI